MRKMLMIITVLLMVCSTALAEVQGSVSLYQKDENYILKNTIDIDGDGTQEKIFFDWYGGGSEYETSKFVQFLPADFEAGNTVHPGHGGYVYLRPGRCYNDESGYPGNLFADGLTIYDKEYNVLSALTGQDGVLYVCVTGVVKGANGIPETFPEFFMQQNGEQELAFIQVDVSSMLQSKAGGVKLLNYPADIMGEYVDALGCYCLVMTQYGANNHSDKLETCFTMNEGKAVLLGRFLNGQSVK